MKPFFCMVKLMVVNLFKSVPLVKADQEWDKLCTHLLSSWSAVG